MIQRESDSLYRSDSDRNIDAINVQVGTILYKKGNCSIFTTSEKVQFSFLNFRIVIEEILSSQLSIFFKRFHHKWHRF